MFDNDIDKDNDILTGTLTKGDSGYKYHIINIVITISNMSQRHDNEDNSDTVIITIIPGSVRLYIYNNQFISFICIWFFSLPLERVPGKDILVQ